MPDKQNDYCANMQPPTEEELNKIADELMPAHDWITDEHGLQLHCSSTNTYIRVYVKSDFDYCSKCGHSLTCTHEHTTHYFKTTEYGQTAIELCEDCGRKL